MSPLDVLSQPESYVPKAQSGGGLSSVFGGGGLSSILSGIGKVLAYGPFIGLANQGIARRQHQQEQDDAIRQAQLAALQRKEIPQQQVVQLGNGGVGAFDPSTGGFNVLRDPTAPAPHIPALQENFNWYKGLSPDDQKVARPMLGGYQYTPEGIQQRVSAASDIANVQGQARAMYRAPGAPRQSPFGRSKANPMPVNTPDALRALQPGTWVSLPDGRVVQRR